MVWTCMPHAASPRAVPAALANKAATLESPKNSSKEGMDKTSGSRPTRQATQPTAGKRSSLGLKSMEGNHPGNPWSTSTDNGLLAPRETTSRCTLADL
uniref:Uncharacterized protein n=1 Tax=Plectus sambesii TaxID=2011161 RepID=A0A914WAX5_9BILA